MKNHNHHTAPISLPQHPDILRIYDGRTGTIYINMAASRDAKLCRIMRPVSPDGQVDE